MRTLEYRIPTELQRTEAIQGSQPDRHTPMRNVAQRLTRRGLLAAKTELCNEALLAMTELCFEVDTDGVTPANVDRGGRILIPAPWGKGGYRAWGLRASEQRALNYVMRQRMVSQNEPLYVYDASTRAWLLNHAYIRRTALAYLKSFPITLPEFRHAWEVTRSIWAKKHLDIT